ncbi:MAG: DUF368 domain-containing protein [Nitriliruptorales bacterium]|nr:DUF368 domain-containing protein [Nitriliruptorales bacterium]
MTTSETTPAHPRERAAHPARHFLHGLMMGGADIIPGVSGGTVALILGIYERLVGAIRNLAVAVVRTLRGDTAAARAHLRDVEWRLVVPLGAGILLAVGIGSVVIPPLLEQFPSQMRGLFFGLIVASLVVPWRRVDRDAGAPVVVAVVAAAVAALLVGLPPRAVDDPALILVFVIAAVAICAMILPGVSGAFLLLVMGVYEVTLHAISDFDLVYVAVFVLGAAVGLGVFSRVLAYLLATHHGTTMAALVGLMAGSLRALWPWQTETRALQTPPGDAAHVVVVAALAVVGYALVTALVRFGDDETHPAQPE